MDIDEYVDNAHTAQYSCDQSADIVAFDFEKLLDPTVKNHGDQAKQKPGIMGAMCGNGNADPHKIPCQDTGTPGTYGKLLPSEEEGTVTPAVTATGDCKKIPEFQESSAARKTNDYSTKMPLGTFYPTFFDLSTNNRLPTGKFFPPGRLGFSGKFFEVFFRKQWTIPFFSDKISRLCKK